MTDRQAATGRQAGRHDRQADKQTHRDRQRERGTGRHADPQSDGRRQAGRQAETGTGGLRPHEGAGPNFPDLAHVIERDYEEVFREFKRF